MGQPDPGIDITFTEEANLGAYLPVQGELHFSLDCSWDRSKEERQVIHNGVLQYAYVHTRFCTCKANLPQISEHHFKVGCKWMRVKDSQFDFEARHQKVYIYRKCQCKEPQ